MLARRHGGGVTEWKLIFRTGGKCISRKRQEFGGGALLGSVPLISFTSLSHCLVPLSTSSRFKDALWVSFYVCGDGLAFSGSALGIIFARGGSLLPDLVAHILGFSVHTGSIRSS